MPDSFLFFHNICTNTLVCIMGISMPALLFLYHNVYTSTFVCSVGGLMPASFFFFHNIYTSTFIFCMGILVPAYFFFFHILLETTSSVGFLCVIRSITYSIVFFPFLLLVFLVLIVGSYLTLDYS